MRRPNHNLNFPRVSIKEAIYRRGKHCRIVSEILSDLEKIDEYSAIKIDLTKVGQKKTHLRAALHRAAQKRKLVLRTTSDEQHLFVFRVPQNSSIEPGPLKLPKRSSR